MVSPSKVVLVALCFTMKRRVDNWTLSVMPINSED